MGPSGVVLRLFSRVQEIESSVKMISALGTIIDECRVLLDEFSNVCLRALLNVLLIALQGLTS